MDAPVDAAKLVPCAEYKGEDAEDGALVKEMVGRGRAYLLSFDWCRDVVECYVGDIAVGSIVAVLLFRIDAARDDVDEWLWVVVGDIPPAYLVVDDAPNPASALEGYVYEMERWVAAVRAGEHVDGLIPVETVGGATRLQPTTERADELESRLRFLVEEILVHHKDDLGAT